MSQKNENLKKISKPISSRWRQNAEYRSKNKWLIYSSKISRRILAAIDGNKELNQTKLASSLNVSPQRISTIVKGKENMTLETIYNLSKALGTELISFPEYKWSKPANLEMTIASNNIIVMIAISITVNKPVMSIDNNIRYDLLGGAEVHYALTQFNNSYLAVYE